MSMSINNSLRIRRAPSTDVTLPIVTMQDSRLSFRARGVLAFLLTFENGTLISTADLPMHGTEGRDAIRSSLRELRKYGYLSQERYSYTDVLGRLLWGTDTVVSDTGFPGPENPFPEILEVVDVQKPVSGQQAEHEASTLPETGFQAPLVTQLTTASCELVSGDTSYLPSVPSARPKSKGWDVVPEGKPKRSGKAAKRAAVARAEEDSTDPFEADLVGDDRSDMAACDNSPMPDGFGTMPVPDDLDARRRRILTQRAKRPVGPAAALADYFALEATEPAWSEPAARFNAAALAKNFSAWRRDGVSDRHIRDMIDEYWHGSYRRNLPAPAWKDFIASQDKIHAQLERRFAADEMEANRHNPGWWT